MARLLINGSDFPKDPSCYFNPLNCLTKTTGNHEVNHSTHIIEVAERSIHNSKHHNWCENQNYHYRDFRYFSKSCLILHIIINENQFHLFTTTSND